MKTSSKHIAKKKSTINKYLSIALMVDPEECLTRIERRHGVPLYCVSQGGYRMTAVTTRPSKPLRTMAKDFIKEEFVVVDFRYNIKHGVWLPMELSKKQETCTRDQLFHYMTLILDHCEKHNLPHPKF